MVTMAAAEEEEEEEAEEERRWKERETEICRLLSLFSLLNLCKGKKRLTLSKLTSWVPYR